MATKSAPSKELVLKHRRAADYRTVYAEQIMVSDVNDRILLTVCDDIVDLEEKFELIGTDTKPRYVLAKDGITSKGVREDRLGLLMTPQIAVKLVTLLVGNLAAQGIQIAGIEIQEAPKET